MMDANMKKWEEALDLEAASGTPIEPNADDPVALEVWFTLRSLEFASQKMTTTQIDRAMNRLANADVIQLTAHPTTADLGLPSWSTLLDKVVAALRPDLALPLPSLRSGAGFESRVFETERFAITIAPDLEGGRGSVLPRHESTLPTDGIIRRYNAAGALLEEMRIDETGIFRFDELEPGDRVELQIGEQWIELPLVFDS